MITHISDTARWVAYYRAMETDRPDAIFKDPFARRLAGAAGEQIVNELPRGRAMAWALVVRTAVFDEMILESITSRGVRRILNLAAGLDARPWRMNLPADLEWIDVDLPDILRYKTDTLADARPICRYEPIALDLTDPAARATLCARLRATSAITLVVTEGLLIYLTEPQVAELAKDLHSIQDCRWWLFDLASPRLLEYTKRFWGAAASAGRAPFQFAPASGTKFFEPYGWREAEFHSASEDARRLGREMRFMWFYRALARMAPPERRAALRRFAGQVLMERTS